MKNATQSDIDKFYLDTKNDLNIYPFMGTSKFMPRWEAQKDNNSKIILTDDRVSYLLNISFSWHRVVEFEVALFAKSNLSAGRGLIAMFEQIKRYRPAAVNTSVQQSNIKSLAINEKILGKAWGIEPKVAWNMITGEYEDLYYFRKLYPIHDSNYKSHK